MTPDQMARFKSENGIADGREWELFEKAGVPESTLRNYVQGVAFNAPGSRIHAAARVEVPERLKLRTSRTMSTQQAFGGVLHELWRGNSALASRIVRTYQEVTVSTNLGPWVNQRGIFSLEIGRAHI